MTSFVVCAIFIEHPLEYQHIAGSHVNNLETNIETVGINIISVAPLAAGDENHRVLVGDIGRQFNVHAEILTWCNLLLAIQLETACADVCEIAEQLLGHIVCDLHVIGKVSAADLSLFCHASLLSCAKYKLC